MATWHSFYLVLERGSTKAKKTTASLPRGRGNWSGIIVQEVPASPFKDLRSCRTTFTAGLAGSKSVEKSMLHDLGKITRISLPSRIFQLAALCYYCALNTNSAGCSRNGLKELKRADRHDQQYGWRTMISCQLSCFVVVSA